MVELFAVLLAFSMSVVVISQDAHPTSDGQCIERTTTYGHNNGDGTVTVTGTISSVECP